MDGNMADSLEILPTCVIVPNLVILCQTIRAYYGDLPENFDPHAPPFKVIGIDMDRLAT